MPQTRRRYREPRWKGLQKRLKIKKRVSLLFRTFGVFIVAALIIAGIYLYHLFTRPFAKASYSLNPSVGWDPASPLNILGLVAEDLENPTSKVTAITLFTLDPPRQKVWQIGLSTQKLTFIGGEGNLPLGSLYGYGNLLDPPRGIDLTAREIGYLLQTHVPSYILISQEGLEGIEGLLGEPQGPGDFFSLRHIRALPQVILTLQKHLRTNLSLTEIFEVVKFIWGIRDEEVAATGLTGEDLANQEKLESLSEKVFYDEIFSQDRKRIQVFNATLILGFGNYGAKVISHLGGEVIRTDNFTGGILENGIIVSYDKDSYAVKKLSQIFGITEFREPRDPSEQRGDITVILGRAQALRFGLGQ